MLFPRTEEEANGFLMEVVAKLERFSTHSSISALDFLASRAFCTVLKLHQDHSNGTTKFSLVEKNSAQILLSEPLLLLEELDREPVLVGLKEQRRKVRALVARTCPRLPLRYLALSNTLRELFDEAVYA